MQHIHSWHWSNTVNIFILHERWNNAYLLVMCMKAADPTMLKAVSKPELPITHDRETKKQVDLFQLAQIALQNQLDQLILTRIPVVRVCNMQYPVWSFLYLCIFYSYRLFRNIRYPHSSTNFDKHVVLYTQYLTIMNTRCHYDPLVQKFLLFHPSLMLYWLSHECSSQIYQQNLVDM